jgi:hypothetical protein
MAKWINTATGLEVPASEVRELVPGSGIYVHETTVTATRILVTPAPPREPAPPPREGDPPPRVVESGEFNGNVYALGSPESVKQIDGYAVKIADDATYDASTDTIQAQALASQNVQRARQGG